MLHSMTGFGRTEENIDQKKIIVEIKSLNSKTLDLNVKMPYKFKDKELFIRDIISKQLTRGKIDFYLSIENAKDISDKTVNSNQVELYINQLKKIVPKQDEIDYLKIAMSLPEAIHSPENEEEKEHWDFILKTIKKTIDSLISYRKKEGKILEKELSERIKNILVQLKNTTKYEAERIKTVKERIETNLSKLSNSIDQNKLEQELVYYIEKFDVTEEKLRLKSNCNYFLEELKLESNEVGKKLGFISQEIGREINTLGSKANHFEMQKLVVIMKDELEKIKEQLLNVC